MSYELLNLLQRPRQQNVIRIQPEKPLALCLRKALVQRIALPHIIFSDPLNIQSFRNFRVFRVFRGSILNDNL